jgi:hypothetical protein
MLIIIKPIIKNPSNEDMQRIIRIVAEQIHHVGLTDVHKNKQGVIFRDEKNQKIAELGFME